MLSVRHREIIHEKIYDHNFTTALIWFTAPMWLTVRSKEKKLQIHIKVLNNHPHSHVISELRRSCGSSIEPPLIIQAITSHTNKTFNYLPHHSHMHKQHTYSLHIQALHSQHTYVMTRVWTMNLSTIVTCTTHAMMQTHEIIGSYLPT